MSLIFSNLVVSNYKVKQLKKSSSCTTWLHVFITKPFLFSGVNGNFHCIMENLIEALMRQRMVSIK